MNTQCDYLIVGGGIAGLTLAAMLRQQNASVITIHQKLPGSATHVSSGLINPVTGQRFVLSWKYEEIKTEFIQFYGNLEVKFAERFLTNLSLIQKLNSTEEQNAWLSRAADPLYEKYFGESIIQPPDLFRQQSEASFGLLKTVYLLNVEKLISKLSTDKDYSSCHYDQSFDFVKLYRSKTALEYDGIQINNAIIFAEGYQIFQNPFFNWLPIIPLKGEGLIVNIPGLQLNVIYKSGFCLIPLGGDQYWCGSNFELNTRDTNPSGNELKKLKQFLKDHLLLPAEIVRHFIGIRPASRDRRPVLGAHPDDSRIIIFNGLGTKGLSLAPYCSRHLANYLLNKKELPPEIQLNRFVNKGFKPNFI